MPNDFSIRNGTASGTLLGIMPTILSEDVAKTIVLACIGAVVSFAMTLLLKWVSGKRK